MGTIFGKESVKEPPYEILLQRIDAPTPYELRKYATRYAVSVEYSSTGKNSDNGDGFRTLARYIGVFGKPQNEGSTSIAMTAPVVMEEGGSGSGSSTNHTSTPTSIAMTAPVVMENSDTKGMKKMMFMLPEEYDDITKIPKPTNPAVHIEMIPSEVGAVYRYNGNFNTKVNNIMAQRLGEQLLSDGLVDITQEYVLEHYQFFGYNPPFTIPYFKRNEVWIKLNEDQVHFLEETFASQVLPSGTKGSHATSLSSSAKKMTKATMISVGLCGLVMTAYAVGLIIRSKPQYRRL